MKKATSRCWLPLGMMWNTIYRQTKISIKK
nr:MAG TPA: hypothetical protein [Caudoviricetes sp.]